MTHTRKRFTNYQQYEIQKKVHVLHVPAGTPVHVYFEIELPSDRNPPIFPRSEVKTEKDTQFTWHDVDMNSNSGYEFVHSFLKGTSDYTFKLRINFEQPYPEIHDDGPKYKVTHMFVDLDRVLVNRSRVYLVPLSELMDEINVPAKMINWK